MAASEVGAETIKISKLGTDNSKLSTTLVAAAQD